MTALTALSGAAEKAQRRGPRVLIIRPSALGDVARTVPCLVSLRSAMPDAQIDWLVHEAFTEVVRYHPALDEVIVFPRSAFRGFLKTPFRAMAWTRELRRRNYDIVIDLQGLLRSAWITRRTRARTRVGYRNTQEPLAWLGYNRRLRVDAGRHAVDRMLALTEFAGYPIVPDMRLYIGPQDQQWLQDWQQHNGADAATDYICLAPTARWLCKCWPLEGYRQVADRLLREGMTQRIVIIAAPKERDSMKPLIEPLQQAHGEGAVMMPQTSVGQLMALLSRTKLLVCNDSGPLHLAVGFDRPIVAIFGPTDPALVGPYQRERCVVATDGVEPLKDPRRYYRSHANDQSLISKVAVEQAWRRVIEQIGPEAHT